MIVDIFNTHTTGGAATAALRLHESLRSAGVESRFWFKDSRRVPRLNAPAASPLRWPDRGLRRLPDVARRLRLKFDSRRELRGRDKQLEIFSTARQHRPTEFTLDGDVINLHWVANWVDLDSFFRSLPPRKPVVWTLHDMNPFTGGCHFAGDCNSFSSRCASCPQLPRPRSQDLASREFAVKFAAVRRANLHVVAPSRWLTRCAQDSSILGDAGSFHTIPYGIDSDTLVPRDKQACRRQLGLASDATVFCFGADTFQHRRKGLGQLLTACSSLPTTAGVVGLSFGSNVSLDERQTLPIPIRCLGRISGADQLATVYSAADVFVLPSLEDNLPQTGLEAMACGVPVVAFPVGGVVDYVRHRETGLLAESANPGELGSLLCEAIADPELRYRLGRAARQLIERDYCRRREAEAYQDLFNRLTAEASVDRAA